MPDMTRRTLHNYPELMDTILESTNKALEEKNIPYLTREKFKAMEAGDYSKLKGLSQVFDRAR